MNSPSNPTPGISGDSEDSRADSTGAAVAQPMLLTAVGVHEPGATQP